MIERAGASAIATTSAGVSWALGRKDGHGLSRDGCVAALGMLVAAVQVPVSVDIESGYGAGTKRDVAETVRAILDQGAVGINLEDAPGTAGEPLLMPEVQAERIHGARREAEAKGVELFINARTDVYLRAVGEPDQRLDEVLQRAALYLEAGADGIFVPGVGDVSLIEALVQGVDAPVNVMAGPGGPSVADLGNRGVARISLGPALVLGAFGFLERAVREVLAKGSYESLEGGIPYGAANDLFGSGETHGL